MTVIEAQRQYQAALEAHRADPDDDAVYDELRKARAVLDTAWLEHTASLTARGLRAHTEGLPSPHTRGAGVDRCP